MNMNCEQLEKNVIDVLCEQQLKLGFMPGDIRLYYPPRSLAALLETQADKDKLTHALETEFADYVGDRLGRPEISDDGDRLCLCFPEKAGLWVRDHMPEHAFLEAFIRLIGSHHAGMNEVLALFRQYGEAHVEPMPGGEEGTLVYFENGTPDDYRYCLTEEMGHVGYHRFTPQDFAALFEEE